MGPRRKRRWFGAGLGAGLIGAIFRTKALHTSLGQVVYHESGSGPALVFVHGICAGASSYEWSKVYPEFANSQRVLAPDLIGFGESARPDASLTASDYARSLAEFIRGTCDGPAAVVASGLGAGLAVLLATQHPEVVRQLVLWMPAGFGQGGSRAVPLGKRLASLSPLIHRFFYRNYESSRAAVQAWLAAYGFRDPAKIPDETADVYATCAQQYGAEHAIRNYYAGRLDVDLDQRFPMLSQPVSILWPEQPQGFPARLQALAPGVRLIAGPRLSQLAALEGPSEIAAMLEEELDPGPRLVK